MSKKEFLLPRELYISKIKLLIEQSRQKVAVSFNDTLLAAIDEPVKNIPLIHYLIFSQQ